MQIEWNSEVKCPICSIKHDAILFSAVGHIIDNEHINLGENPSDIPAILMCPNLHLFDIMGKEIKINEHKSKG